MRRIACQQDVPGPEGLGHHRVAAPLPGVEHLDLFDRAVECVGDGGSHLRSGGALLVLERVGDAPQVAAVE